MTRCDLDVVLYFYGEMDAVDRARATTHLRQCAACRRRLADLEVISRAHAERPAVEAPPAGDWSGFMRRLDEAVAVPGPRTVVPERPAPRAWLRPALAAAAILTLTTAGALIAARFHAPKPAAVASVQQPVNDVPAPIAAAAAVPSDQSLREVSAEHLERSKLVVLGLATRDPRRTTAADWKYERQLAGTLLSDTRLYRLAAQDRGVADVAHVMRDLETVLLEASLSDTGDKDALERVQRLIAKRDLVVKMQMMSGSAGL